MYSYSMGLLVGNKIQHAVTVQANDEAHAREIWAVTKNAHKSKNWDPERQTYKGLRLICYASDDPRIKVRFKVKTSAPAPKAGSGIPAPAPAQADAPDMGQSLAPGNECSININPPEQVPDFRFQETWHMDKNEEEKLEENAGKGIKDDRPL